MNVEAHFPLLGLIIFEIFDIILRAFCLELFQAVIVDALLPFIVDVIVKR